MTINRNNYEEYFLLYVDNELSAMEKNTVDIFISENPDLKEELWVLQQSIVQPDPTAFFDKESLLKPQPVDTDTEEKLLLLLDNELNTKDKEELLSFTKNNQSVEGAWKLLQQTKLSKADAIIFEDKASLYRKEERRVVPIRWWQLAAAAMVIGFGLWGTVSYLSRNDQAGVSAAITKVKASPAAEIATPVTTLKDSFQTTAEINPETNPVTEVTQTEQTGVIPVKTKTAVPGNAVKQVVPIQEDKHENDMAAYQKTDNNTPKTDLQNLNNNGSNIPATAIVTPQTNAIEPAETSAIPADNYAVNKVASDSDENSFGFDDEDDDKPKKSKLGGFFKRVKRTFERKTKIKTGSSDDVKIANMSFAMH
ncbi:MAG: hypothetical protein IPP72_05085 [Chitinophagaceae bacterium]|nr:hypothetical protein [Chitinophagaceae bacterium]